MGFAVCLLVLLLAVLCEGRAGGGNGSPRGAGNNRRAARNGDTNADVPETSSRSSRTRRGRSIEIDVDTSSIGIGSEGTRPREQGKKTRRSTKPVRQAAHPADTPPLPGYVDGKSSDWGIVFSWHQNEMMGLDGSDYRWSSEHIGHKNEFKIALLSVREAHPTVPVYLLTNIKRVQPDIKQLCDVVYVVDLLREAGLDEVTKETGDPKFGFATKAQSLLTGWDRGIIPDKVIHLDVDIAIVRSTEYFNLEYAIEPLQYYDIAGVMEGYSSPMPGTTDFPAVGRGWEMNTGVFAIKRSTAPLLRKWIDVFIEHKKIFMAAESGEQQAFMMALQHSPEYRMFALPAIYNFRRASVHPRNGPDLPVLLHSHTFGDDRANESNWKEIAKHASQIIFEDCYHHMTLKTSKYRYLCDIMVT